MKPISFLAVAAGLATSFLTGCATNPSTAVPSVSSVAVALATPSLAAGTSTTITATVTLSNGTSSDVTTQAVWSSSDDTTALLACTQSPCPVSTLTAGTVTLTATFGGKSGSAALTVTNPTLVSLSVVLSQSAVPVGDSIACSAIGTMSDGSRIDFTNPAAPATPATWTSSSTTTVMFGANGVVTGLAPGMATLTATEQGVTASATLTVSAAVPVSIVLSPTPATVAMGAMLQMGALATLSDGTTQDVSGTSTWSSSNIAVAVVSTGGLVVPKSPGTVNVTVADGSLTASETVTVVAAQVASISITPSPTSISAGLTQQLTATATLTDTTTENVSGTATWTSSNTMVATVSSAGLVTSVAPGSATITATVGTVIASDTVTVGAAIPETMVITVPQATIPLGSTEQLTATATYSDGSMKNVTTTATWTNAPGGLVTGQSEGTVTVTATLGAATNSTMITVGPALPTMVTISAPQGNVPAGLAVQLNAKAKMTTGNTIDATSSATWSSSDTAGTVATVDAATGLLTTIGAGTVTISATLDGVAGTFQFIIEASVGSISVSPATATLASAGATQQLTVTATLTDTNMTMLDVTSLADWATNDAADDIATVSGTGLVTAVAANATAVIVTATVGSSMGSATITVN